MKLKLYHTEVFNKTLSDVYKAGDNTAEVKRLLSRLVNHYFENTVTPLERHIQIGLLFNDLSMAMPDDRERLRGYFEILKPIALKAMLPK